MEHPGSLDRYLILMKSFLDNEISAEEFKSTYLAQFKGDAYFYGGATFNILDSLFASVDSFCPDESLKDEFDIDERQLFLIVKKTYRKLQSIYNQG